MKGLIRKRHLILNAHTIIQEFGLRCYLRCIKNTMLHSKKVTFLQMACCHEIHKKQKAKKANSPCCTPTHAPSSLLH